MADNKLIPPSKNKLPWYEQALPMAGRAAFLPFQDTLPGSVMNQRSFALPGIIAGAANAITAPGRAYSGSDPMFDPQEEAANFALNMLGGGVGASRAAPPPAGSLGMHTWHGSPHRFPPTAKNPLGEFDPTKIGTGEGAQAYGVGAGYLAESPAVAKTYNVGQRDLIKSVQAQLDAVNTALNVEYRKSGSFDATKDARQLSRRQNNLRKELEEVKQGNLYKVDLPDEQIAKMLDWDKPLSQQAAGKAALDFMPSIAKPNMTGQQFHDALVEQVFGSGKRATQDSKGALAAANYMRYSLGIPGIKYLDADSRAGGGTSNFVVFDPKHMNIIGRE